MKVKARVKETGDFIEVTHHPLGYYVTNNYGEVIWYDEQNNKIYTESELEFENSNKTPDYWEKLLHQYAGMAMQGVLSDNVAMERIVDNVDGMITKIVANFAFNCATALVEKLKEEK